MFAKVLVLFLFSTLCFAHNVRHYPEAPLEVIEIGHPTLRLIAQEVPHDKIQTNEIQRLIDDMIDTMKAAGGVGLAAPQVNVSKRIFIMKSGMSIPLTVVINPKVEYLSKYGTKNSKEGCLSIPRKRYTVKRFKRIHMSYFDRQGEFVSEEAKGFKAIVAQHEYDHLDGVMILDPKVIAEEFISYEDYVALPLM